MLLMLCAVILSASLAFAGSPKMSKGLEGKNASDQVDVIVQYKQAPTAWHHEKVLSRGGTLKQKLGLVKSGAYRVPASALAGLAADPDVAYISPDRPLQGTLDSAAPAVNAPYAWNLGYDGTGIGIAVIDSGVYAQFDLVQKKNNRLVHSENFVPGSTSTCLLYTSPSPRDGLLSRMPSSA